MKLILENWWQFTIIVSVLSVAFFLLSKSIEPNLKLINDILQTLGNEFLFRTQSSRAGSINVIMVVISGIIAIGLAIPSVLAQLGLDLGSGSNTVWGALAQLVIICLISASFICIYERILPAYQDIDVAEREDHDHDTSGETAGYR